MNRPDGPRRTPLPATAAPFIRAPEGARTVFLVTLAAACGPLAAGVVLFGWRAAFISALSISSCVVIERAYYFVRRTPALLGRSHAFLTGVLLALTLPPFVDWYVPVVAAAFAIIVGKAVFGGVGHFLWQPALVGRLAVAVMFSGTINPPQWPVLAREKLLLGDVRRSAPVSDFKAWRGQRAPQGADAFRMPTPSGRLAGLGADEPAFSAIAYIRTDIPRSRPAALRDMPSMVDMLTGARPGGIGETCAVVILVAGLYLMYRNYVKWHLPMAMLGAAACVAAVAPVRLAGANDAIEVVWMPLLAEGLDVGFTYVNYQLLSGELLLAAFFLATETTTRPVAAKGQVVFGIGCGAIAMTLKLGLLAKATGLPVETPIPSYVAVLAMNTLTPWIEGIWRTRVLGVRRFAWLRGRGR